MSKQELEKVDLRPLIAKEFATSDQFMEQFGRTIKDGGMFLPIPQTFDEGTELQIKFSLPSGREILAGTVRVAYCRDGANGEQPGCGVLFVDLNERSRKNLNMIYDWQQQNG